MEAKEEERVRCDLSCYSSSYTISFLFLGLSREGGGVYQCTFGWSTPLARASPKVQTQRKMRLALHMSRAEI